MKQHRLGIPVRIADLGPDELTDDEHAVLVKIARNTRMDCWFCLDYDGYEDIDYVLDTENEACYGLKDGVSQLMEGLDCIENIENCNLDIREILVLNKLLERLGLPGLYDYCQIPMEKDYD